MKREYFCWHSPRLDDPMEVLCFGDRGQNFLVFPTSCGRFYDWEDFGVVDSLRWFIDEGWVQLTCLDSVDGVSWYDLDSPGEVRLDWHRRYDRYVYDEVVSFIQHRTGNPYIASVGLSFGAFHAANFAFRHPDVVSKVVSLNGIFDMESFFPDYWSRELYLNSPIHYLPNLADEEILEKLRRQKIFLASSPDDPHLDDYRRLSGIMGHKAIPHRLEIPPDGCHDWPFWKRYLPRCL